MKALLALTKEIEEHVTSHGNDLILISTEAKDLISSIERYGLDELNVVHVTPEEISQRRLEEYHVFGVVKDALADAFSPRKIHPARLRNVAAWAKLLLDECEAERKGDEQ